jgi:hypothetical protein
MEVTASLIRRTPVQILLGPVADRPRLDLWEREPFSPGVESGPGPRDNQDTYEKWVAVEPPGEPLPGGPFRHLAEAVLRYDIFPPWMVSRVLRRVPLEVGDAIGICYRFFTGLSFFCAARVIDRFDGRSGEWWRAGFTYRTLRGHPETGEETFSAEKDMISGRVRVALRSWSRPGILLSKLGYPLTRWIQRRASHAALEHLRQLARHAPLSTTRTHATQTGPGR